MLGQMQCSMTTMNHPCIQTLSILPYILSCMLSSLQFSCGDMIDTKILNVGEELWKETLPFQMGSRLYHLHGLKSDTWYEVKISYPASIPSSFSIQLRRGNSDSRLNGQRKLLNTEKLIFKTNGQDLLSDQGGIHVLVTVEPEGIVAIPHVKERKYVIFNIVCDELLLGIPHDAWWVGILALLCLGVAFVVPYFLPAFLLRSNRSYQSANQIVSKNS